MRSVRHASTHPTAGDGIEGMAGSARAEVDWKETARRFADEEVAPAAAESDRLERVPPQLIRRLGETGVLGSALPAVYGGADCDPLTLGLVHQQIARASASVQGLVNVHQMAARSIVRWGSAAQKQRWLPGMARGETLAAFAISEPEAGSDMAAVSTVARADGHGYRLRGRKKWITGGQVADLYLVLSATPDGLASFLVERDTPGLEVEPIAGLLGCRGYMLAELVFDGCALPEEHLLGRLGFGASHVMATGLDVGRFYLAWACVGVAEACLEASAGHVKQRKQFGQRLSEFQLVQRRITEMVVKVDAARLLCREAAELRGRKSSLAIEKTYVAKYFAATSLAQIANDAVQLLGARGCSGESPVQRYLRDAKIMEIIEGTTEIHQIAIANLALRRFARPDGAARNAGAPR